MQLFRYRLFWIICTLLLRACNVEQSPLVQVYGQVTDVMSGEGIAGVEIFISESDFPYVPDFRGDFGHPTVFTDQNGQFAYSFFSRGIRSYRWRIRTDSVPHLSILNRSQSNSIDVSGDNRVDIEAVYNGYIKTNIKNIDCDQSLRLVVTRSNDLSFVNDFTFEVDDCFDSTRRASFNSFPHGRYTYIWSVLRDDVLVDSGTYSFDLEIGEYEEFTIEW